MLSENYIDIKINQLTWFSVGVNANVQQIQQIGKDMKTRSKPFKDHKFDIREIERIPFVSVTRIGKKGVK